MFTLGKRNWKNAQWNVLACLLQVAAWSRLHLSAKDADDYQRIKSAALHGFFRKERKEEKSR